VWAIGRLGWSYASTKREARASENGPPPAAAGAAAAQAPRVSVHSGRTWWHRRQGPAGAHIRRAKHSKPTRNRTDRAPTDARPRVQPPVPTSDSSPALSPPPSASHRWSTHPSQIRHQPTHHAPLPVAAAPPPAHQHLPGQTRTTFTWHVEEGGQRNALAPLPRKPRREAKNDHGRGGGPFALKTNP
jgi:hypothetical protein